MSIKQELAGLVTDVFKTIVVIREEERRLKPSREMERAQTKIQGDILGIKTASLFAHAVCADTLEKEQAVLNKMEEVCAMIRGEQPALAVVPPAVVRLAVVRDIQLKSITPAKKKSLRPIGKNVSPEVLKAVEKRKECRANGELIDMDRIARLCLLNPGNSRTTKGSGGNSITTTWKTRVRRLGDSARSHESRLKKKCDARN